MKNTIVFVLLIGSFFSNLIAQESLLFNKTWKVESYAIDLVGNVDYLFHEDAFANVLPLDFKRISFNADGSYNGLNVNLEAYVGQWELDEVNNLFISNLDTFNLVALNDSVLYVRDFELTIYGNSIDTLWYYTKFITTTDLQPNCPTGDVVLTSQDEIDDFLVLYPDCTELNNSLIVSEVSGPITNLNGLNQVNSISGNLFVIGTTGMTQLYGLSNLISIGGQVVFKDNISLTNFNGLTSLTTINGMLVVKNNESLTGLTGLNDISQINGKLEVSGNNSLYSITGLGNLTTVNGDLQITDNPLLYYMYGLSNLATINGELAIENNDDLPSLDGLQTIDPTSIDHLVLRESESLTTCQNLNICTYLESGGSYEIEGNGWDCRTFERVSNACAAICPEDITLRTQEDIDDFAITHPGCTVISGDLWIYVTFIHYLTNLDGLQQITSVEGDLHIYWNDDLTSIAGLSNLTHVGGKVSINLNTTLSNLNGLHNLKSIGEGLSISSNGSLSNLNALSGLESIGGDFIVSGCDNLTNIAGLSPDVTIGGGIKFISNESLSSISDLPDLSSVQGDLVIYGNDVLMDLSGLEEITAIQGKLELLGNSNISDLSELNNLRTIDGGLTIHGNPILQDLTGLSNLRSINGDLLIKYNLTLTNLEGLNNIDPHGISDLEIFTNQSLSSCSIESICSYLNFDGSSSIQASAPGCSSVEEILDNCVDCPSGQNIWIGPSFGNWHGSPTNWSRGVIPSTCDQVLIPAGHTITIYPTSRGNCYELEVEVNAVLDVRLGGVLNVVAE